jgi:TRAP-type C4-dicarboxylate transport system permease small subunit
LKKYVLLANKIWGCFAYLASALMVINVMVIILNIIMRRFFNMPIFGSTEFIRYISLGTASMALCQNEWVDGNIRMSLILEHLKKKTVHAIIFVVNLICSGAFAFISYLLIDQAIDKYFKNDVSPELYFPMWIPAAVLSVGFCVLTATLICKLFVSLYTLKTGEEVNLRGLVIGTSEDDVVE